MKHLERTIVICPNCGEDNSDNFRYCGMCGSFLEARRPTGSPLPGLSAGTPKPMEPLRTPVTANSKVVANAAAPTQQVRPTLGGPPISGPTISGPAISGPVITGPSMLGLDLGSQNQPSMDSLREKSFSGLDSFFEPEQPKTGGGRILLLVVLLAALGVAGWWAYTNYVGLTGGPKAEAPAANTSESPATQTTANPTDNATATPEPRSSQPAEAPSRAVPESPGVENAGAAAADANHKPAETETMPKTGTETAPAAVAPATPAKAAPSKREAKRERSIIASKAASTTAPAPADTGDAAFRKGEAYLYGRGVPENCGEAVKNLKAASAKTNAKARSAFGTMYATGHCVPRDLPTSYLWFALALQADPNNQILEKDLSAIWNQMTPPERQMATRMKQ
jgi:zinc-ribbon domain